MNLSGFFLIAAAVAEIALLGLLLYVVAGYPRLVVRRCWFRFSLRSQLLLVTVFAIWFGWNVRAVDQRRSLAAEIAGRGGIVEPVDLEHWDAAHNGGYVPRISTVRRWLGDEPVGSIDAPAEGQVSSAIRESAKAAFPEALLVFGEYRH